MGFHFLSERSPVSNPEAQELYHVGREKLSLLVVPTVINHLICQVIAFLSFQPTLAQFSISYRPAAPGAWQVGSHWRNDFRYQRSHGGASGRGRRRRPSVKEVGVDGCGTSAHLEALPPPPPSCKWKRNAATHQEGCPRGLISIIRLDPKRAGRKIPAHPHHTSLSCLGLAYVHKIFYGRTISVLKKITLGIVPREPHYIFYSSCLSIIWWNKYEDFEGCLTFIVCIFRSI